jgi:hypothetical protein
MKMFEAVPDADGVIIRYYVIGLRGPGRQACKKPYRSVRRGVPFLVERPDEFLQLSALVHSAGALRTMNFRFVRMVKD